MTSASYVFQHTVPAGLHFQSPFGEIVETTGTPGEPFEHYKKIFRHEVTIRKSVFREPGTKHFVDLTKYTLIETTPQNAQKEEQPKGPITTASFLF